MRRHSHPEARDIPAILRRREIRPDESTFLAFFLCLLCASSAFAQQDEAAMLELARKAQDPLAEIKALMTDNMIAFNGPEDDTTHAYQIQPVHSLPTDGNLNMILRGVI